MQQRPPPASLPRAATDAGIAQFSDEEVVATATARASDTARSPNPNTNLYTSSATSTTAPGTHRASLLRSTTHSFLLAFLSPSSNPPSKILSEHFVYPPHHQPRITEHGPSWATARLPFLGRTFTGVEECTAYFDLLAETLEFLPREDTFPGLEGIVVDADAVVEDEGQRGEGDGGRGDDEGGSGSERGRRSTHQEQSAEKQSKGVVCVVGKAKFRAVRSGKEWEESFIYRLSGFDREGRIGHWEIWADPLSAWEAVGES